jgi:hypothetical protein
MDRRMARIGCALVPAMFMQGAFAQAYPVKPVRILVGYTPGGGVDTVPAKELLHGDRVMRLVGLTEIVGQGAETARIPPAPGGDQRGAEQKPEQRRRETAKPRMAEEELQHEGEGR